jgi:hypothetical protein
MTCYYILFNLYFYFNNAINTSNTIDEFPIINNYKAVLDANWRYCHYYNSQLLVLLFMNMLRLSLLLVGVVSLLVPFTLILLELILRLGLRKEINRQQSIELIKCDD